MSQVNLIFPHQLFQDNPLFEHDEEFYIIEEYLFFNQYRFHKQKLALHRASMKFYVDFLKEKQLTVTYIDAQSQEHDICRLISYLPDSVEKLCYIDPVDDWLTNRLESAAGKKDIQTIKLTSPQFLNEWEDIQNYFREDKKKFHQTTFYKQQRKQRNILMKGSDPDGGKWTYDTENRKKYPSQKTPPDIQYPKSTHYFREAKKYIEANYADNPGALENPIYPIDFVQAEAWLNDFLKNRFEEFGPYEDAIVDSESVLNHSVLSPLINIGLLTPKYIIDRVLEFGEENELPINSIEGFVRQVIGWREFIRGIYVSKGVAQRTCNFWNFKSTLPESLYNGTTGIPPIDQTIQKVLNTGYCHHIERLMLLANFMTLCEIHPDDIYRWFMELFIDAYDWVMVPNVYGMATFSDGGLMSTKPYISGSNYVRKMSNYSGGDWEEIWDGLFWRFMHVQRDFFESNPRLNMLLRNLDRMGEEKLQKHLSTADDFLNQLTDYPKKP